ncbi:MAG: bifunctional phosphopantothenoylcysteine decarboxylase/phosphopantothenate--cysteine ligase CoaBC [Acaryochloridaceae cyanobacterium RU_4_10]|nr:bifunctional phosphopantothenoylcysteine decarboxylase/phosphopantothenate--cysteine ligase CoaBC [Acaryochloridaceae cyanobacterium RU_4_10]
MTSFEPFVGQRILVGIGGGVAAYKVCEIISTLVKSGVEVRAILTDAAQQFITPLTVATLCRHRVYTDADFWAPVHDRPLHIQLGEWADVFLIAPLTANTLGKLALGLADNLLTNTVLASTCPILVAPAMNTIMWQQPTVQENWHRLQQMKRIHSIGPAAGLLACDTVGTGRMAEPKDIVPYLQSLLDSKGHTDLKHKRILISSGGTREFLDPVRFLGNPSTGKMGLALATAASHRGAEVCLVQSADLQGPTDLPIETIDVVSAAQMQDALATALPKADWIIMAAAVADVKPQHYAATKLPKHELPTALPLEPVPDIVRALSQLKQPHQCLIGFAAQTGDIVTPALEKLKRKGLDGIVANPIDLPDSGFGSDRNQAIFIDAQGQQTPIPNCTKLMMAHRLLDLILQQSQKDPQPKL